MVGSIVPRPSNPPVDLTIRDFKSDRALGRSSLISQIADAAAEQICGLYGKSPSSVVRTIPFGSGTIDNARPILSDLCENISPPPPPPQSQFSGGQCDGVAYNVVVTTTKNGFYTGDGQVTTVTDVGTLRINAPITGAYVEEAGTYTVGGVSYSGFRKLFIVCKGFGGIPNSQVGPVQFGGSQNFEFRSISLGGLNRADGLPDTCGNVPPSYPSPTALPNDLDGSKVINIAPNTSVTVPVRVVPTFAPTANIFKPEFNINVGGINVNISGGGFTFSPTVQIEPNVNYPISDPRSSPPPPIAISPPSSAPSAPTDLTPVITKLDELLAREADCCVPEEPAIDDPKYIRRTTSSDPLESGRIVLPDGTYKVRLLMTVVAPNAKSQWGGTVSDVYFAGHAWFDSGFSLGVRTPIDAQDKQFIPPNKDQSAFVWTYNVGYLGICTIYYKELR